MIFLSSLPFEACNLLNFYASWIWNVETREAEKMYLKNVTKFKWTEWLQQQVAIPKWPISVGMEAVLDGLEQVWTPASF